MGDLKKWAGVDKSGQWHSFRDDGMLEGVYESFSIEDGEYGEAPVYVFTDAEGERIKFQSSSKSLARQMDEIAYGTGVRISRSGSGTSTHYEVEVVK